MIGVTDIHDTLLSAIMTSGNDDTLLSAVMTSGNEYSLLWWSRFGSRMCRFGATWILYHGDLMLLGFGTCGDARI